MLKGNKCQAGHKKHEGKTVPTRIGAMYVYDCDAYPKDIQGYCNGKDDISRSLISKGSWADEETTEIINILAKNRDYGITQRIIDFGCHIGWYTIIAANMGYMVEAIDGDRENVNMTKVNSITSLVSDRVNVRHMWIDGDTNYIPDLTSEVELIKIDLEGNEQYAIKLIEPLLAEKKVKHIHMEVSPVFNNSYPGLVDKIAGYGFIPYIDGKLFNYIYDFPQANLLFKRKDLP